MSSSVIDSQEKLRGAGGIISLEARVLRETKTSIVLRGSMHHSTIYHNSSTCDEGFDGVAAGLGRGTAAVRFVVPLMLMGVFCDIFLQCFDVPPSCTQYISRIIQ